MAQFEPTYPTGDTVPDTSAAPAAFAVEARQAAPRRPATKPNRTHLCHRLSCSLGYPKTGKALAEPPRDKMVRSPEVAKRPDESGEGTRPAWQRGPRARSLRNAE